MSSVQSVTQWLWVPRDKPPSPSTHPLRNLSGQCPGLAGSREGRLPGCGWRWGLLGRSPTGSLTSNTLCRGDLQHQGSGGSGTLRGGAEGRGGLDSGATVAGSATGAWVQVEAPWGMVAFPVPSSGGSCIVSRNGSSSNSVRVWSHKTPPRASDPTQILNVVPTVSLGLQSPSPPAHPVLCAIPQAPGILSKPF